jgi:hypothetical protein
MTRQQIRGVQTSQSTNRRGFKSEAIRLIPPCAEFDQLVICALALAVVTIATTSFMQGIAMVRLESVLDRPRYEAGEAF